MITSEISKAGPFTGDGETLIFDFSFIALDADHVAVYVDGVKVTTGFTVELLTGGGRVTFAEAPEDGALVSIIRDVPAKQETDLQNNTAFLPEVIETAFDRLTMMIQQMREVLSRTLVLPPTEEVDQDYLLARFKALEAVIEDNLSARVIDIHSFGTVSGLLPGSTTIMVLPGMGSSLESSLAVKMEFRLRCIAPGGDAGFLEGAIVSEVLMGGKPLPVSLYESVLTISLPGKPGMPLPTLSTYGISAYSIALITLDPTKWELYSVAYY